MITKFSRKDSFLMVSQLTRFNNWFMEIHLKAFISVNELISIGQHYRVQFNNLSILPNAEMAKPDYKRNETNDRNSDCKYAWVS